MVVWRVAGVVAVRRTGDALHAGARVERRVCFLVDGIACCGGRRAVCSSAEPPSSGTPTDVGSRVAVWRVVQLGMLLASKRRCDHY